MPVGHCRPGTFPNHHVFLLPWGTRRYSGYVLPAPSDATTQLKRPTAVQCMTFPTGRPLRHSLDGTVSLKLMFPNPSSRSSLATRLTRSAVLHLRSTSFLTPAQEFSRQVPASEGEAFARRMNSLFIETSAKTAVGVSEAFKEVAEKILDTPELWAPAGQHAGGSAGGNRTRTNDDSMPGSINLGSNEAQLQEGCAC